MKISIIVAVAKNGAIGKGNELLWKLPDDMRNFKEITSGHAVIMGRKTFESIGRPLPNRKNIVITRQANYRPDGVAVAGSLDEAIEEARKTSAGDAGEEVFVIGGAQIYKEALSYAQKIYLTRINSDFEGDAFFPDLPPGEWSEVYKKEGLLDEKNNLSHTFLIFERIR